MWAFWLILYDFLKYLRVLKRSYPVLILDPNNHHLVVWYRLRKMSMTQAVIMFSWLSYRIVLDIKSVFTKVIHLRSTKNRSFDDGQAFGRAARCGSAVDSISSPKYCSEAGCLCSRQPRLKCFEIVWWKKTLATFFYVFQLLFATFRLVVNVSFKNAHQASHVCETGMCFRQPMEIRAGRPIIF